MRRPAAPAVLAAAVLLAAGAACRRIVARDTPAGGGAGPVRASGFRPSADGILTEADLDVYVKVRRAAKGRTEAGAASAVGVDPERFAWIQARIVEALVALDGRRVRDDAAETYGRTLASLRETRRRLTDAATSRSMDARIAQLERERALLRRAEPLPPRVAGNARRVAPRRSEIEAVSPR